MSASLTFVTPPPGLDPVVDFVLDEIQGASGLYALSADSAPAPATRLFVIDAAVHLPDYSPFITDEQSESLGVTTAQEALLLVIANPAPSGTTVNLMAPIVVNASTGMSAQLILEGQDWPLRAELRPRGVAAGAGAGALGDGASAAALGAGAGASSAALGAGAGALGASAAGLGVTVAGAAAKPGPRAAGLPVAV